MIDTHTHLDGEEFLEDLDDVIMRAKEAGIERVMLPAIDHSSSKGVIEVWRKYQDYAFPMLGLHPEEVKEDWKQQLSEIRSVLNEALKAGVPVKAIGEIGLDYYWSREFEKEQLEAFEEQIGWSIETGLPLMIHCRKGQNEMVKLLRRYEKELPGGVFHCFTGNSHEAEELLSFDKFVLGIGGVLTFKKSNLPETLAEVVPLDRIVLETDAPYMAPVPMRGKRNEPAFVAYVLERLAMIYGVEKAEAERITNATVARVFGF